MTTDDEQLLLQLSLHLMPGIGPVLARNLVSYCGGVKEIFKTRKGLLRKIPGIGAERADIISKNKLQDKAREEIKFIRKYNVRTYFYLDDDYPSRLKNCDDAPVMLFLKGNADLDARRIVSIVGTRNITPYGKDATENLVKELSQFAPLILSGLAYGVDIQAHKTALKENLQTVGVIAHGLDRMYPSTHHSTAEKMIEQGGLLTEYIKGTVPDKENFPARNRIVAGLSDAVVVIESARRGGALITAEIANSYNRDVFAMPGRINDVFSQGCHDLIRKNKATIFESAAHIAEAMNWNEKREKKSGRPQLSLFNELNSDEKKIIERLRQSKNISLDQLAIDSDMPVSLVSSLLLSLEFAGFLKPLPGKIYELI